MKLSIFQAVGPPFLLKSVAYIFLRSYPFKFFLFATKRSLTNFYTPESTEIRSSHITNIQSITYSSVIGPSSPKISFKVSGELVIAGPKSLMKSAFLRATGGGLSTTGTYPEK